MKTSHSANKRPNENDAECNVSIVMGLLISLLKLANLIFTVLLAKSDSDVLFCLQLLCKTLTCTLQLS